MDLVMAYKVNFLFIFVLQALLIDVGFIRNVNEIVSGIL